MPIIHSSRAVNPRDLQVGLSQPSLDSARCLARALQAAGVACAIHEFPEFQGNWYAVCVDRKRQLKQAQALATAYANGRHDATTHRCASPHCPGYPYRASDLAHPAETCNG